MALGLKKTAGTTESVEGIVLAGQTLAVDSFVFSNFKGCKYHVGIWNIAQNKFKSFDFNVVKTQTDSVDTTFGVLGSVLGVEIWSQKIGLETKINVKNNEVFDVSFKMMKLNL